MGHKSRRSGLQRHNNKYVSTPPHKSKHELPASQSVSLHACRGPRTACWTRLGRPCMESLQLCNVAGLRRPRRSSEIHIWLPWLRSADAHWRRSSSKPRPLAVGLPFPLRPAAGCSAPVVPPPHPRKADGETLDLAAARSRCCPPPLQTKHMATGRLLSYIVVSTTL